MRGKPSRLPPPRKTRFRLLSVYLEILNGFCHPIRVRFHFMQKRVAVSTEKTTILHGLVAMIDGERAVRSDWIATNGAPAVLRDKHRVVLPWLDAIFLPQIISAADLLSLFWRHVSPSFKISCAKFSKVRLAIFPAS